MDEFKKLLVENKDIIANLDTNIANLVVVLNDIKEVNILFLDFFKKQDSFMETVKEFIDHEMRIRELEKASL